MGQSTVVGRVWQRKVLAQQEAGRALLLAPSSPLVPSSPPAMAGLPCSVSHVEMAPTGTPKRHAWPASLMCARFTVQSTSLQFYIKRKGWDSQFFLVSLTVNQRSSISIGSIRLPTPSTQHPPSPWRLRSNQLSSKEKDCGREGTGSDPEQSGL